MKHLFTLLGVFYFISSLGQTIEKQISSVEFNSERTIKINLPEGYENDTVKKYPIAIVLDNDYLFDLYVGNSKIFAESDLAPQQIVVGLDVNYERNKDVSIVSQNGGLTRTSKKFYNYISKEVVPYLEANLKTSPFLSIIGQGKAANFLTHFLKEGNPMFNAYVAISPSFNDYTQNLFVTYNLKRLKDIDNTFYLYMSNNNLTSEKRRVMSTQLRDGLQGLELENLKVSYDNLKSSPNLPSAISTSIPHALSEIFELYARISKQEFDEHVKDLSPLDAIEYLEKRYIEIEYLYGTNLDVRMEDIFAIESIVMDQQDGDYLRVLGDFVMIKHPESPLGDYYVGMYHELGKDYERADSYYRTGYGKIDPSDPHGDDYYKNIERITRLMESAPKAEPLPPIEEEIIEEEQPTEELPKEDE